MFIRHKKVRDTTYLQLVEGFREDGRVRQRVLATLGRLDRLRSAGTIESLMSSLAAASERLGVLGDHRLGLCESLRTLRVGPSLVFQRLWEETGVGPVLRSTLGGRAFEFAVEAAVFLSVLHRIVDPGSDRAAEQWKRDYWIPGIDGLELHHLYKAMAWLGEPLPDAEQRNRTPFSPRCVKDRIEESLFHHRRHLFTDLVLALFDTTSLHFEGAGGQELGRKGHSKNKRSDLNQIVLGIVMDSEGNPVCSEVWPGNTTDVTTLLPVVDRLRERFGIRRICVVADRGMISRDTMAALEALDPPVTYILGARMRSQNEVREDVLARGGRYQVVYPPRERSKDPAPLEVKEVWVEERRYVICRNEEEARKDAFDREAILAKLRSRMLGGDKAFVSNKGFRRFLKSPGPGFEIDEESVRADARLDGKFVLRTNAEPGEFSACDVAVIFKELWQVESIFRSIKTLLRTRPVFHKKDANIRGHVFCSFLALVLIRELQDRLGRNGQKPEWADLLRDLNELAETDVRTADGKRFTLRSELKGWCGAAFQAVGVAIPPHVRTTAPRDHSPP
ncbi:MAG: transposase IS4 family [candidate division NC10 bacterium]|nr:transposase IS4 family [candidate division NC10 bacterium]